MKRTLSKSDLKAYLKDLKRADLENIIIELYNSSDISQKILEMRFESDKVSQSILNEYENLIDHIFFPSKSSFKAESSKANRIVSEFQIICPDLKDQCQLILKVLECETEIVSYGYISESFCSSILTMWEKLVSIIDEMKDVGFVKSIQTKIQDMENLVTAADPDFSSQVVQILDPLERCVFSA